MNTKTEQLESRLSVLEPSNLQGVLASNSTVKRIGKYYEIWGGVLLFKGTFNEVQDYINEQVYRHSLQFED